MTSDQPWWLTMPPAELAVVILPLFSNSASQRDSDARACIVNWCKSGSYRSPFGGLNTDPFKDPDHRAVIEAMQALEHAGLLVRGDHHEQTHIGLTRLGWHALQTNTVRQHLGLSEAPPTGSPR
jgi:hypothetical protein